MDAPLTALQARLSAALVGNPGASVYLLSLDGETDARGPGHWRMELHLDAPAVPGGVLHLILGEGSPLPPALLQALEAWMATTSALLGARRPPRIDVSPAGI